MSVARGSSVAEGLSRGSSAPPARHTSCRTSGVGRGASSESPGESSAGDSPRANEARAIPEPNRKRAKMNGVINWLLLFALHLLTHGVDQLKHLIGGVDHP